MDDVATQPSLGEPAYLFQKLLGFRLIEWREDWARFELPLSDKFANRHGTPHGGVYAALLDTVMGYSGDIM
ncbi:PaaI family thioesterase [Breoghania sp.]|uniref:PaaI family thioesterase n=1 Tax=Breoghania sp. TaxID=2065378 RepID=UPI0026165B90|nr:PaaI family thioesterase [Breoghania sp.]MDJ0930692.1 PaaI family thioesterase [Breoghania sp.]